MLCWSSQVRRRAPASSSGTPSTPQPETGHTAWRLAGRGTRTCLRVWGATGLTVWWRCGLTAGVSGSDVAHEPTALARLAKWSRGQAAPCVRSTLEISRAPPRSISSASTPSTDMSNPRVAASSPSSSVPTPSRSSAMPTSRCHRPHCPSRFLPQHRSAECPDGLLGPCTAARTRLAPPRGSLLCVQRDHLSTRAASRGPTRGPSWLHISAMFRWAVPRDLR